MFRIAIIQDIATRTLDQETGEIKHIHSDKVCIEMDEDWIEKQLVNKLKVRLPYITTRAGAIHAAHESFEELKQDVKQMSVRILT